MKINRIVIAVDGFSSCGKSTFAKLIAQRLGYTYIDTGAMYRAITLAYLRAGGVKGSTIDDATVQKVLHSSAIGFSHKGSGKGWTITLNGVPVDDEVRSIEVSQLVSQISAVASVRKALVDQQQRLGRAKGVVMDGRDIGTVVFPNAELKIFMTADSTIRAQRRFKELKDKGVDVNFEEILFNIEERDRIDQTRSESPLRRASDAVVLDNSYLTVDQQMEWFDGVLRDRFGPES